MMNAYVAGSKFTLWWVSRDVDVIPKLRYVRMNTRDVVEFVEFMRLMAGDDNSQQFENDHQLLEHVAIISYLVDRLQTRAGFHSGPNEQVYKAFRKTWRESLQIIGESRGSSVPVKDELENCLNEYEGLNARLPTPETIQKFARSLVE